MILDDTDIAALIGRRFLERRDVKARMFGDGTGWAPDHTKWTMSDLRSHLDGDVTLGHYLTSPEDKCRVFAFDIDLRKPGRPDTDDAVILSPADASGVRHPYNPREVWLTDHFASDDLTIQLRYMAEGLALRTRRLLDIPVAVAFTGNKGLHVYGFTGQVDSADARGAALEVLDSYGTFYNSKGKNFFRHTEGYEALEIEVFPKQDTLDGKDLGNLMRLPLGVDRKTGRRTFMLDLTAPANVLREDDPVLALQRGSLR